MKNLLLIILIGLGSSVTAQVGLGSIKGKVFKGDSTDIVPQAIVRMEVAGDILMTKADFEGRYVFNGVKPGTYNISYESTLDGKITISGIIVKPDQITDVDAYMTKGVVGKEIVIVYKPKKIDINNITSISSEELQNNINIQNPKQMLVTKSSEISMTQDEKLVIRGSRPGDVIYYVDGVKQNDMQSVPGIAIGGMTVYTGGVPAKYGDTTGGVVILETKGYFDLYYAWLASQDK